MHYEVHFDGAPAGPWMGHLPSEPGCIWLEQSAAAALAAAPAAIAAYHRWLARHGEPGQALTGPASYTAAAGERQTIPNFGQSGAAVGIFPPDHLPADNGYIATVVRRLGYARQDLLALVAELPPAALDWQSPSGKRTVRLNLHHVRNCQGWYLTRVLGWPRVEELLPEPWPEETFHSLNWVMERAIDALLALPPELRAGTFRATEPDETWTPRKMLRRFVEHECEHVQVIRRTVGAWKEAESR